MGLVILLNIDQFVLHDNRNRAELGLVVDFFENESVPVSFLKHRHASLRLISSQIGVYRKYCFLFLAKQLVEVVYW